MYRVPVIDQDNKPLMPTKASRARRWVRDGKAVGKWDDLGNYYVQLVSEPSGAETQPVVIGIDPGKSYSGIGVQSTKTTLFRAHIILPFGRVRARMDQRCLLRRGRRSRRIDRTKSFKLRNHRQCRFSNRCQGKLAPSIKASRDTELRVVRELVKVYPVTSIVYERVRADIDRTSGRKGARSGKGFSPVMVGQRYMLAQLAGIAPTVTREGWQKDGNGTSQIRKRLGLVKDKQNKADAKPETHAVDGVALACGQFVQYRGFHTAKTHGKDWVGDVEVTNSLFRIITRPGCVRRGKQYGYFRRQLQFEVPAKKNIRKPKGIHGTVRGFRAGDFVRAAKAGETFYGYVGGWSPKVKVLALYDWQWKRINLFSPSKTTLIRRSNGLCIS